ncbi:glycosyltransferase [Knoellia sp. CPCC 206450]|uniref:glycosyltransferase n=1 Tax=Knoellia tibetensis TaxID=3404798 RepID=UPI003B4300E8
MKVGWYVHHHGAGHRTRAHVVGRELVARGASVTLLGSDLDDAAAHRASLSTVRLAMDAPVPETSSHHDLDVAMHGSMHWAPLWHSGFRERMTTIARWVQVEEPDVVVVDVSCEVAVLVRLLGVPVVVVAQPGERTDSAHTTAYAAATAVLAPWPAWATGDLWRTTGGTGGDGIDDHRVVAVGGISRHGADGPCRREERRGGRRRGLVLSGSGGFDNPALVDTVTGAVADVDWTVVGGSAWVPDVREQLARSEVVVMHAGQNAIADVAAWRLPSVVVPQRRPFAEQTHMGAVLAGAGIATVVGDDETAVCWPDRVESAIAQGGAGWERWGSEGAVARAASLVEVVGGG